MATFAIAKLARDLSVMPPRSPRQRLRGYAIMARMIDKGRATLNGTAGEYRFGCPVDSRLFSFKGISSKAVREMLFSGATDEEFVDWFDAHGLARVASEVVAWSEIVEADLPYENPEKREWFVGECERLGLDPKTTTLFDYLEFDDRVSFQQ